MNSYEESFPSSPFVLVVDRSGSMKGEAAIELINRTLPELVGTLGEIPEVEESGSVGLISFANHVKVHRRIEPIYLDFDPPRFKADGGTSYAAPLKSLRAMIETDVPKLGRRGRRPVAFFITDGHPNAESTEVWKRARAELLDGGFCLRPKLVALGCGQVDTATLRELASTPNLAHAEEGPTREALRAILNTIQRTIITISGDGDGDDDDLAARILAFHDYDIGDDEVFEYRQR